MEPARLAPGKQFLEDAESKAGPPAPRPQRRSDRRWQSWARWWAGGHWLSLAALHVWEARQWDEPVSRGDRNFLFADLRNLRGSRENKLF